MSRSRGRGGPPARTGGSPGSPDEAVPSPGEGYLRLLGTPSHGLWRPLLGVPAGVVLVALLIAPVNQAVLRLGWMLQGAPGDFAGYQEQAAALQRPVGLLASNLSVTVFVVVAVLLVVLVHQRSWRCLLSVTGRVRWRFLLGCVLLSLPVLLGTYLLTTWLGGGPPLGWSPASALVATLAVVVLTSPLQAVAEEVFFRGYLLQALGTLGSQPWLAVLGSGAIFALFHGTQNVWLFLDRLAFGVAAALLVHLTGGLEAACAAHVANNVLAFGLATLTGTLSEVRVVEIGPLDALADVGGFLALALVLLWLARRMAVHTRVPSAGLG